MSHKSQDREPVDGGEPLEQRSSARVFGPAAAVPVLLRHGLAVVLEVSGDCMSPGLPRGRRVRVEKLAHADDITSGDVVVLVTKLPNVILLHRTVHVFGAADRRFVIHQGDAPNARPGIAPLENVVGRAIETVDGGAPLPILERLGGLDLARFLARRLAATAYARLRAVREMLLRSAPAARLISECVLRRLAAGRAA